ncbi:MAG: hypothetical protein Q8930_02700, partial [Bacillota bacterium]|nr:hypothetical protein [Bacillota bacterium]
MKPLLKISGKSQRLGKKNSTQNYRTPKRKSIASRISLTIAVIIAGVMTLTSIVIYSFIYDGMVNRNKESMDVISNEVYENFNSMVSVQTNRISDLAIDGSVVDLLNGNGGKSTDTDELKKEINAKLKGASSDAKDTEHTFITDSKGRVICDSHEEYLNYDYSQNQCVILAQGGNLNMSTVHISPETG